MTSINTSFNPFTAAPGTANSQIRPEADLSFEESNQRVDEALIRSEEAQQSRADTQTTQRTAAAQIVEQQQTRENAEQFIEQSSGADIDSASPNVEQAQDLAQSLRLNQAATAADNSNLDREAINERQREALQDRIRNALPDDPTTQPVAGAEIDETA
ncbi:hypothetical protein R50073_01990 [Maricurvus nonylphenolicus]|uniref:hypothetical protein n=1 Tax=Maricurvus nonylphenolicus TaxID=1008307 RepID=UPI0036F24E29